MSAEEVGEVSFLSSVLKNKERIAAKEPMATTNSIGKGYGISAT
jgi:hypothetical protein